MERFLYTVWISDSEHESEDQDREWPACLLIRAASEVDALSWGDYLSRRHSEARPEHQLLRSNVDRVESDLAVVPIVEAGIEVPDEYLSW